ncbi:DNA cytosine methyltransferase [Methylobacterium sp. Gmos1]
MAAGQKLRVLDLFSGIGGFSLGLERTGGFETVAFCEIEPFCQRVLAKHWPEVPCYDDVRDLTADRLRADGIAVDVICGGFPCQDISISGPGAGLSGARSGLWFEYARLIGELRPRYAIVENVAELLDRGIDQVLGTLASIGYDAWWDCIPAVALGADHERDRVWLVAYPDSSRLPGRLQARADGSHAREIASWIRLALDAPKPFPRMHGPLRPLVGGRSHGVPHRVDRVRSLGNSVLPQIPELIGYAILASIAVSAPLQAAE